MPTPGSSREADGVLLADLSGPSGAFLVVLDAERLTELAVFSLPYRLPVCHALLFVPRGAEGGGPGGSSGVTKSDEEVPSSGTDVSEFAGSATL